MHRRMIQTCLALVLVLSVTSQAAVPPKKKDHGDMATGTFSHYWKDYRFRVWTDAPPFRAGPYQKIWLKVDRWGTSKAGKSQWWYVTLADMYGKVFPSKGKVGVTAFGFLERKRGLYLGRFKVPKKGRYRLVIRMEDHGTVHEFDVPLRAH